MDRRLRLMNAYTGNPTLEDEEAGLAYADLRHPGWYTYGTVNVDGEDRHLLVNFKSGQVADIESKIVDNVLEWKDGEVAANLRKALHERAQGLRGGKGREEMRRKLFGALLRGKCI